MHVICEIQKKLQILTQSYLLLLGLSYKQTLAQRSPKKGFGAMHFFCRTHIECQPKLPQENLKISKKKLKFQKANLEIKVQWDWLYSQVFFSLVTSLIEKVLSSVFKHRNQTTIKYFLDDALQFRHCKIGYFGRKLYWINYRDCI